MRNFSYIGAVIAVIGFTIAGFVSDDVGQPLGFIGGIFLGLVILVISAFSSNKMLKTETKDGTIANKYTEKEVKNDKRDENINSLKHNDFTYTKCIVVRFVGGGNKVFRNNPNDEYYFVGDVVRYHVGLDFLEKYDKSRDTYIPCCSCGAKNETYNTECSRCHTPLLK